MTTNTSSLNEASDLLHDLVSPFSNSEFLRPPLAERRVSAPVIRYQSKQPPSQTPPSSLTNSLRPQSPTPPSSDTNNLRPLSPTPPSSLTNSIRTPSPRSPTYSDSSFVLSPLSEEDSQNGMLIPEKKNEEGIVIKRYERTDRRLSDEKAVMRRSIMISRSMEDLSHLAEEEDGMVMAMHQDTFQMGLMSLRTPVG